jgi:glycosyltransferase involved in cell wall biosynthesis
MRVLHVISALAEEFGGPVNSCLETAQALAARGHDVTIYTTDNGVGRRLAVPIRQPVRHLNFRIQYHRVAWTGGVEFSPDFARSTGLLRAFDVVHVNGLFNFPVSWTMAACRGLGVPYVVRPLGSLAVMSWKKRMALPIVEAPNLRGADRVHFSTGLEDLSSRHVRIPMRRIVIPEGVHLTQASLLEGAAPLEGRYIVYLGRLHPQKGFDILLPAFAEVRRRHPDLLLALVGPDNTGYRPQLERECARLGIDRNVRFLGMLTGAAKFAALANSAGLVLPSHSESYGRVVVEAAASGAPVALSDRVGLASLVAEAGAGWVSGLDASSFAGAVNQMLAADRVQARERALAFAKGLSWESCAAAHERMYEAILAERRGEAIRPESAT